MIGKKNMVFGFAYFVTTLLLGIYMAGKAAASDPNWEGSEAEELLKQAHVHGNLESLLNIVIGYLLCRLPLAAGLAKTVSVLLLVGAVFHSGMLYLDGFGIEAAIKLAPIGAVSLVTVMVLMAYGVARVKQIN